VCSSDPPIETPGEDRGILLFVIARCPVIPSSGAFFNRC
jgi:hypothetical protein